MIKVLGIIAYVVTPCIAFTPSCIRCPTLHRTTLAVLHSHAIDSENEAMMTMMRAAACAHSDTCSIDDAEKYIDEILNLQSSCVSGSLSSPQICDDVIFTSEVISELRQKIRNMESLPSTSMPVSPLLITLGIIYAFTGVLYTPQPGIEPFTIQEWIWSIRDGYFTNMLSEFIHYGGFKVDSVTIIPFTPQEWWWSIRDGYFVDLFSEYSKNGGFLADDGVGVNDLQSLPFEAKEWVLSARDGYFDDMVSHYFRNGGL